MKIRIRQGDLLKDQELNSHKSLINLLKILEILTHDRPIDEIIYTLDALQESLQKQSNLCILNRNRENQIFPVKTQTDMQTDKVNLRERKSKNIKNGLSCLVNCLLNLHSKANNNYIQLIQRFLEG